MKEENKKVQQKIKKTNEEWKKGWLDNFLTHCIQSTQSMLYYEKEQHKSKSFSFFCLLFTNLLVEKKRDL